jgi:hypothetical protein
MLYLLSIRDKGAKIELGEWIQDWLNYITVTNIPQY